MRHNSQLPSEDFTWNHHDAVVNHHQMDRQTWAIVPFSLSCHQLSQWWQNFQGTNFWVCEVFIYFTTIQINNSWIFRLPNWDFSFRAHIKMTACCAHATAVVCSMVYRDLFIYLSKLNVMSGARVNSCLSKLFERCIARRSKSCLPEHVMTRDDA